MVTLPELVGNNNVELMFYTSRRSSKEGLLLCVLLGLPEKGRLTYRPARERNS